MNIVSLGSISIHRTKVQFSPLNLFNSVEFISYEMQLREATSEYDTSTQTTGELSTKKWYANIEYKATKRVHLATKGLKYVQIKYCVNIV